MAAQRFEVRPQTGTFGAEIAGIDLTQPIDSDTAAELYATWLEYSVLFFRDHDQPITPPQYIAFATNGVEPRFSAKLRFDPYFQTPLDSIYASVPTKVADVPLMVLPFHIELR
jgi:hypothetical protein